MANYFTVLFGKRDEMYGTFLKHSEIDSYNQFSSDFFNSVKIAVQNILKKPMIKKLTDWDLIELGVKGLIKKGYKFATISEECFYVEKNPNLAPFFLAGFPILNELHFFKNEVLLHTEAIKNENIYLVAIWNGVDGDEIDYAIFHSPSEKGTFHSDCNQFHPIKTPVNIPNLSRTNYIYNREKIIAKNIIPGQVDFIQDITEHLNKAGYNRIEEEQIILFAHHSLSDYWLSKLGAKIYNEIIFHNKPKISYKPKKSPPDINFKDPDLPF